MSNIDLEKMVNDHWDYVRELLIAHGEDTAYVTTIGYHYKSAFKHGFKHAQELYKFGKDAEECEKLYRHIPKSIMT